MFWFFSCFCLHCLYFFLLKVENFVFQKSKMSFERLQCLNSKFSLWILEVLEIDLCSVVDAMILNINTSTARSSFAKWQLFSRIRNKNKDNNEYVLLFGILLSSTYWEKEGTASSFNFGFMSVNHKVIFSRILRITAGLRCQSMKSQFICMYTELTTENNSIVAWYYHVR